jgi:hypothetical protein
MANRIGFPATPARGVRNMLAVVPVPKSKILAQLAVGEGRLTQALMVKSVRPLTMPVGSETYSPLPLSRTALPSRPWTRGPVAPPPMTGLSSSIMLLFSFATRGDENEPQ